ncbi:hypothetical protein J6590_101780 [Homalodisca vitripennis]|nr:hypothetical protein J6590_101780 [Homalodisca vitripennis]
METKTTDKSKGYTLVSKKRKKSSNSDTEARTAKKDKVMKPRLRLGQDSDDSGPPGREDEHHQLRQRRIYQLRTQDPPTPRLQPGHQRTSLARLFRPCSSTPRWEEQRSEKTLWKMMIYDVPRGLEPNEPGMFSKEYQVNGDGVKNLRGRHRVKVCGYLYQSRRLAKTG